MLIRMVKEHPQGRVYRVRGYVLEAGKEAVEVPDEIGKRMLADHPGVFEAEQSRAAVSPRELKRG